MERIKNIFTLFLFWAISINSQAQKFEWVNFFQGQNIQAPVSLSVDSSGNQYASFYFKDQIKFKSITVTKNNYQSGLVLKQNSEGKVLWYKVIEGIRQDLYTLDSKFNSKGNLIVLVTASGPSILVGSDTLKRNGSGTNYAFYLLEFNDTGKLINGNHLIDGVFYGFNVGRILASDKNDNLYLVNAYTGQVQVYDSSGTNNIGSSTSGARNIIFKFSRSGKKLEWTSTLPYSGLLVYNIKVDIHENVYAATYWTASSSTTFTFKGQTMRNPQTATGAIFVWDKKGNDKSFFCIKASDKNSVIYDIAVYDSNSVFISGAYQGDSALFETVWEKNNKLGGYLFYARYDINGKLKWVNVEDTSYSTIIYPNKYYCGITNYKDAFFYLSYYMPYHYSDPVIFDGQKYEAKPNGYGLNLKVDDKGNILWGYRTLYPFSSMGTDANDNLYFQGRWDGDTIKFNNIKAYPNGTDGFLGKTTDYSITRGEVYAGPYCAGDTIIVPFTKKGDYDTSNYFIAELSDEFGIFEGNERELGRIKSTRDSVVIGKLPLFKTASSANYRIRIISTNPIVQSYYRFDKLRLLIYSVDKADPGPAETICYGDSIKLSTYGGTKWTWSPKYNMTDSTARQPFVWPIKDTVYKIIIADSSGCGEADTAFKQIYIREPIKLSIVFYDTIVCDTSLLKLPMVFAGGDSANYQWNAFNISASTNVWNLINSGKSKRLDTLFHYPKPTLSTGQKIAIVLDDNCTNKKDTAFLNIYLLKPSKIANKLRDTLVCYNAVISRKAKVNYPNSNYQWQWLDLNQNKVISANDSIYFNATANTKIRLTLTNGCTSDTGIFLIQVNTPIKAQLLNGGRNLNDTTLCFGQSLNLKSNFSGGSGVGIKREWFFDGKLVSNTDNFSMQSTSYFTNTRGVKQIIHVLKDNCTPLGDSVSKIITVVESPNSNYSYRTVCSRTLTDFKFTGSVPASPITNSYNWSFEGEGTSNVENPSKLLSITGKRKVILDVISSNGCKDQITKIVEVKKQPKADFTFRDVCENDSAVFTNFSKDASSYSWNFGDGKESKNQDVKHKYPNGVNPKTYNVKLVALAKDGCSDSIAKTISVVESPIADFSFGILCSRTITEFKFTGTKPSNPVVTTFYWNLNNEANSVLENPSQQFSIGAKKINLKVMSNSGCSDILTKVIEIKPQATADFSTNDVCESDSVIFKNLSTDATGYLWKFGDGQTVDTNSSFSTQKHKYQISSTTTYNVTLVSQVTGGCADSIVKAVTVNANPKSGFTYSNNQNTVWFKADETATSYKWYFGNGDSATASNKDFSYTYSKNPSGYTVCLIAKNAAGCVSKSCKELFASAGISSLSETFGIKIYPNPNLGNFTIEIENPADEGSIEVYNSVGELVKKVERVGKVTLVDLDVESGIYLVKVKNGGLIWNKKVSVGGKSNR